MKSKILLAMISCLTCTASVMLFAETPSAIPSPTVKPFDQKDIPPPSQKEIKLSFLRKSLSNQRDALIDTLTTLDIKYADAKTPDARNSVRASQNILRAKLVGINTQITAVEKQLSRLINSRVEAANPSTTTYNTLAKVKNLQKRIKMVTARAAARSKLGLTEKDPEYGMMAARMKTYTTKLGTLMSQMSPTEIRMLNEELSTAKTKKSK